MDVKETLNPLQGGALPWLLVKIREQVYALDVGRITSIFQINEEVTPVNEFPDCFRGILFLRGEVTPLLDMRRCLGLPSIEQEFEEFRDMLDARKDDHIRWIKELQRCVDESDSFSLATDPHKCALGKWYDSYHTDIVSIEHHLNKLDAPHKALHETAREVIGCKQNCEQCEREVCLKEAMKRATEDYVPSVLRLLEETKEIFKTHFREMCIVLESERGSIGLLVDDVLAVEDLEMIRDGEQALHTRLVTDIAHSHHVGGEVLVLSEKELLSYIGEQQPRAVG